MCEIIEEETHACLPRQLRLQDFDRVGEKFPKVSGQWVIQVHNRQLEPGSFHRTCKGAHNLSDNYTRIVATAPILLISRMILRFETNDATYYHRRKTEGCC